MAVGRRRNFIKLQGGRTTLSEMVEATGSLATNIFEDVVIPDIERSVPAMRQLTKTRARTAIDAELAEIQRYLGILSRLPGGPSGDLQPQVVIPGHPGPSVFGDRARSTETQKAAFDFGLIDWEVRNRNYLERKKRLNRRALATGTGRRFYPKGYRGADADDRGVTNRDWHRWFYLSGDLHDYLKNARVRSYAGDVTVRVNLERARVADFKRLFERDIDDSLKKTSLPGGEFDRRTRKAFFDRFRPGDAKARNTLPYVDIARVILHIFTNLSSGDLPYLSDGRIYGRWSGEIVNRVPDARAREKLGNAGGEFYRPVLEPVLTWFMANRIPKAVAKSLYLVDDDLYRPGGDLSAGALRPGRPR